MYARSRPANVSTERGGRERARERARERERERERERKRDAIVSILNGDTYIITVLVTPFPYHPTLFLSSWECRYLDFRNVQPEREGGGEREKEGERLITFSFLSLSPSHWSRELVRWCFKRSQPQRIISGLKDTFIKRYTFERTN